jgi:hypothetical protein
VYVLLKRGMNSSELKKKKKMQIDPSSVRNALGFVFPEVLITPSPTKPPTDICLLSNLF